MSHIDLRRFASSALGNLALVLILVAAGSIYSSSGSSARDLLVTDLFVNITLVVGLQIFVGNTGVLSFGHLCFATIGGYATALLGIPAATKAGIVPDAPWGLAATDVSVPVAMLCGVLLATAAAALIGPVIARAPGLAATMISLALLFVVEQIAKNWTDLTNGGGRLSGIPGLDGNGWPIAGAAIAVVVATLYRSARGGRLAVAGREDELAAGALGVDIRIPRYTAFVVSGTVVALGGALQVRAVGSMAPEQFNFDVTILVLAMLVVGGMHTVTGAVVGATFITIGKEVARRFGDGAMGLPAIDALPDLFLAGSLLTVLVITRRPNGMMGDRDAGRLIDRWLPRRAAGSYPAANAPGAPAGDLVVDGLGVVFGGFTAVEGVDLRVAAGEMHGLIGPNGAGKTTVVNALTGLVPASSGHVHVGRTELTGAPHRRARRGVSRTFQNLRVFANLTVRENVETAALVARRHRAGVAGPSVDELLAMGGLEAVADRPAGTLDYGNQRRLEIARAAALRPAFLLLDEPTSGMSEDESAVMVHHVRAVAEAIGAGVLVIDHDLGFITAVSDHITVLDQGRVLASGSPDAVMSDPRVIDAYLGTQTA